MSVDLVELLRELLYFIWSVLDELSGCNKLPLVFGLSHDDLVNVLVGLENLLYCLLAVCVDAFEECLPDLVCLVTELLLHLCGHHTEHGVVNDIVAQVQNRHIGFVVMLNLLTNVLDGGFIFTEEVLYELFPVNIQDILVLFILLKQLIGTYNVLLEHRLNFSEGFHHPREVLSDGEVRLLLLLKEWHEIVFQVADLVCRCDDHCECTLKEVLALLKLREVVDLV